MHYEAVIGVEVHAQLLTQSKLFCSCRTEFGLPPNTQTCPVCLGMPGTLPVVNQKAVEFAIRTGVALNCTIRPVAQFARKNYFYPDLPKGYQISQYEAPICESGVIDIKNGGQARRVRIRRAHLEEDAGKNIHRNRSESASLVDLNRAGTPLLEIVTEPDLRSSEEVVEYLKRLRDILVYIRVCDGNMEQGSLRCEPNVSIRSAGSDTFGTKVELKNINSFKFVRDAVEYEIKRQTRLLEEGEAIQQETRLWDVDQSKTTVMRSKEEAHDYRYFPDPDLPPLHTSPTQIEEIRRDMPELPTAKKARLEDEYGLPAYDAEILTADKELADFFEDTVKAQIDLTGLIARQLGKETSNWIMVELVAILHREKEGSSEGTKPTSMSNSLVTPDLLAKLLNMKRQGQISGPIAKLVLEEVFVSGQDPEDIVRTKGLTQLSDEGTLEKLIDEVLETNPQQVAQYQNGKETVLGFFVGRVMKASEGKANPQKVNELLKKKLAC